MSALSRQFRGLFRPVRRRTPSVTIGPSRRPIERAWLSVAAGIVLSGSACAAPNATTATTATTDVDAPTVVEAQPSETTPPDHARDDGPRGFQTRRATLMTEDGTPCELCVWLADTPDQHRQGLMGVSGLGGADAMAFVYKQPTKASFWMKDTIIPLEIMFVGADGQPVGHAAMEPCTTEKCELYGPDAPYVVAVEFGIERAAQLDLANARSFRLDDQPCRLRTKGSG